MLWAQFADYHADRCEAVARHLDGRAVVVAVEVATASQTYAWAPSRDLALARKITLFPGQVLETIGLWKKLWAQFMALRQCDVVCCGVGYNEPDIIILSWLLRLCGVRLILMTDSKFDDKPRSLWFEAFKALLLAPYPAAIVAGPRQASYLRFLGFARRPITLGYDCVSVARIREQADAALTGQGVGFEERDFVFVGRFVEKKNLPGLIDAYAQYRQLAGPAPRRLVLCGSGPQEAEIRARIAEYGLTDCVYFPGFLDSPQVAQLLAKGLALLLVSTEEQWGLVVNEAVAVGLPVIVSTAAGAGDVLVRNLVNGFVVEASATASIAEAMLHMAADEAQWRRMSEQSRLIAAQGDVAVFAEAVDAMAFQRKGRIRA